ncbi:hypothetical protein CBM2587_B20092 [Cupriavidus taiwanensis]|uniref:Uncharacterized protein n=1 Tax=Cupriavidus taiwanensis TaxID=164546 RepID=A0A375C1X1_9BURK|nr:hypothetical protein CBM2587_B20092 [Cupriavidus taiwanensis]
MRETQRSPTIRIAITQYLTLLNAIIIDLSDIILFTSLAKFSDSPIPKRPARCETRLTATSHRLEAWEYRQHSKSSAFGAAVRN